MGRLIHPWDIVLIDREEDFVDAFRLFSGFLLIQSWGVRMECIGIVCSVWQNKKPSCVSSSRTTAFFCNLYFELGS